MYCSDELLYTGTALYRGKVGPFILLDGIIDFPALEKLKKENCC